MVHGSSSPGHCVRSETQSGNLHNEKENEKTATRCGICWETHYRPRRARASKGRMRPSSLRTTEKEERNRSNMPDDPGQSGRSTMRGGTESV